MIAVLSKKEMIKRNKIKRALAEQEILVQRGQPVGGRPHLRCEFVVVHPATVTAEPFQRPANAVLRGSN